MFSVGVLMGTCWGFPFTVTVPGCHGSPRGLLPPLCAGTFLPPAGGCTPPVGCSQVSPTPLPAAMCTIDEGIWLLLSWAAGAHTVLAVMRGPFGLPYPPHGLAQRGHNSALWDIL